MRGALRRHVLGKQDLLILLPSLVLTAIFVFAFVGTSFLFSLTNWRTLAVDLSLREPLWQTYADMLSMPRFQADLRNTFVFTLLFISCAPPAQLPHTSRMRCNMNHAVVCVTPKSRWSFMLDTPFREVSSR